MKIEKIDNVSQVDLQELAAIFNQYRQFYKQDSNINSVQEFLQKRIENQDSSIFIAKNDEDKIIGFAQIYYSFSSVSIQEIAILNDLFVNEDYRNKKVAIKIIESAKELCLKKNITKIFLETQKDNRKAKNLYKKIGFIKDEVFDNYLLKL